MPRRTPSTTPTDPSPEQAGTGGTASEPQEATTTPADSPRAQPQELAFFSWIRGLGLTREAGWLGGVCGGIAARIGIDALIVRGIAVVLAAVGAPVALLYALAWLLLPDAQGTIHGQQLGHGRVTRALPGIVAVFLASLLPLTQLFWSAGSFYWGDLGWGGSLARIGWTGALVIVAVVLIVWLARRAQDPIPLVPATTDDQPGTVPTFPRDAVPGQESVVVESNPAVLAAATTSASADPLPEPGEPPTLPADASAEELAAWKASQSEWQRQRAAWAAEQKRSERDRRQAEAHARAIEAAEASRERARIRKLTRPRARAGVVFLVLGVALVAAALSAFAASGSAATRNAEWIIGAAMLVLVLGIGTVVVGLARRRSGALAVFSILSVLALAVALVVPGDRQLLPPGANWGVDTSVDGRFAQFAGSTNFYVLNRDDSPTPPEIDLWQWMGNVEVWLNEGATVHIIYTTDTPTGSVEVREWLDEGGRQADFRVIDGSLQFTVGDDAPDLVLRVWAGTNTRVSVVTDGDPNRPVTIDPLPTQWWEWQSDKESIDLLEPTPTPVPSEGVTP